MACTVIAADLLGPARGRTSGLPARIGTGIRWTVGIVGISASSGTVSGLAATATATAAASAPAAAARSIVVRVGFVSIAVFVVARYGRHHGRRLEDGLRWLEGRWHR